MIAGKTESGILSMDKWTRYRWYKTISLEKKEEAMKIVDIAGRIKNSISHMGNLLSEETRAKISAAQIGRILSKETRAKMSIAAIERMKDLGLRDKISKTMTGRKLSEETKTKISVSKTGIIFTKEHKDNMSAVWTPEKRDEQGEKMIELWEDRNYKDNHSGENHHMYGKIRNNHSEIMAKFWKDPIFKNSLSGENASNWQGGKSFEPYGMEFDKDLRMKIRNRDNCVCQECGITQEKLGQELDVHHIDYDKRNNKPGNLISLCRVCHSKTGANREDWTEHFREMIRWRGF